MGVLTRQGTHGIGMFEEDENADMILLDSVAYSISDDGTASEADEDDQVPFVMVTSFQPPQRVKPPRRTTRKKVMEVFERNKNSPMSFRISGKFGYISTKQQTYWDVNGTIFGFSIPSWQKDISGEGPQCCFLADDKSRGGRVSDFETGEGAILEWAKCGRFHLGFPQDEEFDELRLRRSSTTER